MSEKPEHNCFWNPPTLGNKKGVGEEEGKREGGRDGLFWRPTC